MPSLLVLAALGLVTAGVGTLGGIGGAILLVPVLTFIGVTPPDAAPLGLAMVAAGSLAAAAEQLDAGIVHHRLGTVVECAATAGAVVGALASTVVPGRALEFVLAFAALGAAAAGLRPLAEREIGWPVAADTALGERFASLSGVVERDDGHTAYRARRLWAGLPLMTGAGVIAGLAGIGAGFIKTPTMTAVMHVPVKVAAATATFAVGVTSAAGLAVFAAQGRINLRATAAVAIGALIGGLVGATAQQRVPPRAVSLVLSAALVLVGILLLLP